ncbi:hypothetical protein KSS87_009324 [Heliosperma pusillum]|nr:hypothetical protein KSS87_009324 [Heliosperma pusillum]
MAISSLAIGEDNEDEDEDEISTPSKWFCVTLELSSIGCYKTYVKLRITVCMSRAYLIVLMRFLAPIQVAQSSFKPHISLVAEVLPYSNQFSESLLFSPMCQI